MSSALRLAPVCCLCLSLAGSARAQTPALRREVVLTSDAVGADVFAILQGAFARAGIGLERAPAMPACTGTLADPEVGKRVWIAWAPAGGRARLQLCFQDHCRSAERTLGPVARLDASAREELITVVESGLGALALSCPSVSSEPAEPVELPTSEPAQPFGVPTSEPPEAAPLSAAHAPMAGATENVDPASHREPGAAQLGSAIAGRARSQSAASAGEASVAPPPARSVARLTPSAASAPLSDRRWLAIGGSYGFARWSDGVLAQRVGLMAAYALHERPVYLGVEVGYAPRFRALHDALAISATCVRLAVALGSRLRIAERWSLEAELGPAIEWLSLEPEVASAGILSSSRATSHFDPLLFLRVGPAFHLYTGWLVGLEIQLDATWIARNYGFESVDGPRAVFAPDRLRLSFALHTRVEL